MGTKRALGNEFQELPFKQPRFFDYKEAPPFSGWTPCYQTPKKPDPSGDYVNGFLEFPCHEAVVKDSDIEVPDSVGQYFSTATPFSWASNSSSEEDDDTPSEATAFSSLPSECFEYYFPPRIPTTIEGFSSSLSDRFPRKQVPVGLNHQAGIPIWCGRQNIANNLNKILVGTCIIPKPDSNLVEHGNKVENGRVECRCMDKGSLRCVLNHIKEARKYLRESLGDRKFLELGFSEMGDEVAHKWSVEEEEAFYVTVYSNPSSSGGNFWKHLSRVFPYRSNKELVRYYFNVFMLRKRAFQNRNKYLEIDSDNDDLPGSNEDTYESRAGEEDEESPMKILAGENGNKFWTNDYTVGQVYLSEHCSGPTRDIDLIPTSNMIEEIFGQGSMNDKNNFP